MTLSNVDPSAASRLIHLRGGGVSVLLDATGPAMPEVLHWGADLGDLALQLPSALWTRALANNAVDIGVPLGLLPEGSAGWRGRRGLVGSREGRDWSPALMLRDVTQDRDTLTVLTGDDVDGVTVTSELVLDDTGVLRLRHSVRNDGDSPYTVEALAAVLPVPARATEVLDLTGRWCREQHPQRRLLHQGTWIRESRRGRTGHDRSIVLAAGTPGFGFRHGELWSVHLGWSGDATIWAERGTDGRGVLGAAELFGPDEIVLAPGESYTTPWTFATWSDRGLDATAAAQHRWLRARPHHPSSPRPVVLNTWEAVYFDHRLETLVELADAAAELGVERFVLDDGWFRHRRNDEAGLGDWYVDEGVWPQGLTPLIQHVTGLGMQFGLWVEPEMINPDSDLFRAHPDWILAERPGGRQPVPWRNQQVLDLANPDAYAYILERLDALLTENDIAFFKWDHNRDIIDGGHHGRPGVHLQTRAVYRLLDELRARHPRVEIESCSSGGARVDLGILERTDRVWASDCNDALERQTIQRWTGQVLTPELIGAHVGPPTAHTTGRTHVLSFRAITALFGHFGIEWDVRGATPEDRAALQQAIEFYKAQRGLLHGGTVVRLDSPDPSSFVHGVVAPDASAAVFAQVQVASSAAEVPAPVQFPGLDDARTYRVQLVDLGGSHDRAGTAVPGWVADGAVVPGSVLRTIGLSLPALLPERAQLLHLTAV